MQGILVLAMPVLAVRDAKIPYEIRRSRRARRLRIVVKPGKVEVVAPSRAWRVRIDAFVRANRRWIYDKTESLRAREAAGEFTTEPQRYVDGARILFRGRKLRLHVAPADIDAPELEYRSAFHIRIPRGLTSGEREAAVERCLTAWLENRARVDAGELIRRYAPLIGKSPTSLRIKSQKTVWGSCSARGVVALNRRLLAAPRPIFEYVVVHELCHLVERNHSPKFWRLVASLLPDYRQRRAWLKRHWIALG